MPLKLREYQKDCLQSIHEHYAKGVNRQLIHMATGAGKTVVFANLIHQLKRKTLVLAHTCELLDQSQEKITMIAPHLDVGIVRADRKELDKIVVVSSIQSARQSNTLSRLKQEGFSLCIYDECHRSASEGSRLVLDTLGFGKGTNKLLCGFSATPFRNDELGLGEIYDEVVYKATIKDLIKLGYLCQPKGVRIKSDLDLSTVKTADGDFVTDALADYMNTPEMNELVVESFIENASDRKTVCFTVSVDHARTLSKAFQSRGIASECIHGGMAQEQRENTLKHFQNGSIQVLTNCQILTEGWDCPEVDCVLVAKPTQSKGLYQQMCGRGLRLFPNKKNCLILDFGSKTHSLCSMASLVEDTEEVKKNERTEGKMSEFVKGLPPTINKKLKAAIIEFDLLGDDFTWIKNGSSYSLRGIADKVLKIFPTAEGRYTAIFFNGNHSKTIAQNLSFEYAFAAAEEFAKENRSEFIVSDLGALWRQLPISDKQKICFRSFGYRAGIENLNRGQAALIISSGVLKKKTAQH